MNGIGKENMLYQNFTFIYNEYLPDTEFLISVAKRYLDVESWINKNKKRLGKISLDKFKPRFIFDHLYKLDCVLDLGQSKLGIQITTDDTSVDSKLNTLTKLKDKGLYEAVGIDQVILVLVKSKYEDRLWSSDEIEETLFDTVDYAYESDEVRVFTFEVPN